MCGNACVFSNKAITNLFKIMGQIDRQSKVSDMSEQKCGMAGGKFFLLP